MKLTINTDVLRKYNLSLGQFIVLLTGYYGLDCVGIHDELVKEGRVEKNLFQGFPPILSNNTKDMVAKILTESDDRIQNCGIKDFEGLAQKLIDCYPTGNKPGTTHLFSGTVDEIAQKLRVIVTKYGFPFTEEEAVKAVDEYVCSFKDYKYMLLLRNFILKTSNDGHGHREMDSMFMTIIENNRKNESNN